MKTGVDLSCSMCFRLFMCNPIVNNTIGLLPLSLLSCRTRRVLNTTQLPLREKQTCCDCNVGRTFERAPIGKESQRFDTVGSFSRRLAVGWTGPHPCLTLTGLFRFSQELDLGQQERLLI